MAIPKTSHIWTYDDYLRMPDDGRRYEILDGELFEMPGPTIRHQAIVGQIFYTLREYVKGTELGEVYVSPLDVKLSPIDVVQPDVLFVSRDNAALLANGMNVQGPPDLCIEVLSPGTSARDRQQKRDRYTRFRVREYWLVDPDTQIVTVLALHEGAYDLLVEATGESPVRSVVLPDFSVAARSFFA